MPYLSGKYEIRGREQTIPSFPMPEMWLDRKHPEKITEGAEMTIEEYKAQPFKDATIGDYWFTFDRKTRREIERLVKKGKNPDIMKYV